jgi:phage shock protein PspC (stress-responsive transcriptional regulator)
MSTAASNQSQAIENVDTGGKQPPLPLRADTILGVCEAVGQDLGFNPNFLRIPFAALILWNPPVIIGSYLGLGAVVALSRWLFPAAKPAAIESAPQPVQDNASVRHESKELLAA